MNTFGGIVVRAMVGTLFLTSVGQAQSAAMRYRLNVGDRLHYERSAEEGRRQSRVTLTCLDDRDGRLLVLIARDSSPSETPSRNTGGGAVWLAPTGEKTWIPEFLTRAAALDELLDVVPVLSHEFIRGSRWSTPPDHYGCRLACVVVGSDERHAGAIAVEYSLDDSSGAAEITGESLNGRFWFDGQRGVVSRVETTSGAPRIAGSSTPAHATTRITRLVGVDRLSAAVLHDERTRFEALLRVLRREDRLTADAIAGRVSTAEARRGGDASWKEWDAAGGKFAHLPVAQIASGLHAAWDDATPRLRVMSGAAQASIGRRAATWSLPDESGATVRAEALRDRLVVEASWSAESIDSLRQFEVLRGASRDLPAEALRIVCINVDADIDSARRAARSCGAGLAHVFAGPALTPRDPALLPTMRLIGRDGIVRAVWYGWQPRIVEALREQLR